MLVRMKMVLSAVMTMMSLVIVVMMAVIMMS